MTGIKNRVSDEAIDQSVRTVFAEEEEIMETILDRWKEQGRQEALLDAQEALQEAEKLFEQRLQQERQEMRAKSRKSILSILNHILALNEADQKEVEIELAKIDDIDVLYRLSDVALESSTKGLIHFTRQLALEQPSDGAKSEH